MVFENFDLSKFNGYKIAARCKRAFLPQTKDDLLRFLDENERDSFKILGSGHNVILQKEYYDTTVLILSENYGKTTWEKTASVHSCYSLSGTSLKTLSCEALELGATGLEYFYDIPSSLGGAVVMNAGTRDAAIGNIIDWVGVYDCTTQKYRVFEGASLSFTYRNSSFQDSKNKIIVDVGLRLKSGQRQLIESTMENQKKLRWSKQPREFPNCGSVFKRPSGMFVGPMIESIGLKGYCIGDACVSDKHAGFIVNKGNASGRDIVELISFIKREVKKKFDVDLEVEQRII